MRDRIMLVTGLMIMFLGFSAFLSGALCEEEHVMPPLRMTDTAPRLILAGRGIATYDVIRIREAGEEDITSSRVDFADASLLLELDAKSESGTRGGFLLGLQFPDPDVDLGTVFFHEINVFLDAASWSARIGRSRLANSIVDFPTLRDDDILDYAYVRSAFSASRATQHSQFGNVVRGDVHLKDRRLRISAFGSNLAITDRAGVVENAFELNSGGVQVYYEPLVRAGDERTLREIGAGLFSQKIETETQEWMHALLGGAVIDLNTDPIDHWELRLQGILNFGTDLVSLDAIEDRALSQYGSFVASVRYLRSAERTPRLQAAFTVGYQEYLDAEASRLTLVPSFVYRLPNRVDLLVQFEYEDYRRGLEDALGFRDQTTVWLGLAYDFEMRFNDYSGGRDDAIDKGHEYLP